MFLRVPNFKFYHCLIVWSFVEVSLHSDGDVSILMEMVNSVGFPWNEIKAFEAEHAWLVISSWIILLDKLCNGASVSTLPELSW